MIRLQREMVNKTLNKRHTHIIILTGYKKTSGTSFFNGRIMKQAIPKHRKITANCEKK